PVQARLSAPAYQALRALKTRERSDPAIALLDAWATVADILTLYQERIANEDYLRTATERRSVLEQARLVGYRLRPGVAASVYLAYTLEDGREVTIPQGSRAQTVPGPGEKMQSFETEADLEARGGWNALRPRTTRPQDINPDNAPATLETVYFKGTATNLKANDRLLFVFDDGDDPERFVRRVESVEVQAPQGRTKVALQVVL